MKELIEEYVQIYGHDKWGVSTYSGNVALINNYILPTIGDTKLASINTHFMEKYYKDLLKMPEQSLAMDLSIPSVIYTQTRQESIPGGLTASMRERITQGGALTILLYQSV